MAHDLGTPRDRDLGIEAAGPGGRRSSRRPIKREEEVGSDRGKKERATGGDLGSLAARAIAGMFRHHDGRGERPRQA